MVLYGPKGAGRPLLIGNVLEKLSGLFYLDVAHVGESWPPSFSSVVQQSNPLFFMYDLYFYARANRISLGDFIQEASSSTPGQVWIIDNASLTPSKRAMSIVQAVLESSKPLVVNLNGDRLDYWLDLYKDKSARSARRFGGLWVGDPEDDDAKASRAETLSMYWDSVLPEQALPGTDALLEILSLKVGWRLHDLCLLVKQAQTDPSDFADVIDALVAREKERMAHDLLEMDEECAVWTWDTLDAICNPGVVVGGLAHLTNNASVLLSRFKRVPPSLHPSDRDLQLMQREAELSVDNLSEFSRGMLELVQKAEPPPFVAIRALTAQAFGRLSDDFTFRKEFWEKVDRVHELEDIYFLGVDIQEHLEDGEKFQQLEKELEHAIKTRKTRRDDDDIVLLKLQIWSKRRSLDVSRRDILHRLETIFG